MLYPRKATVTAVLACLLSFSGGSALNLIGLPTASAHALPIVLDDFSGGAVAFHDRTFNYPEEAPGAAINGQRGITGRITGNMSVNYAPQGSHYRLSLGAPDTGPTSLTHYYGAWAFPPLGLDLAGHQDVVLTLRDIVAPDHATLQMQVLLVGPNNLVTARTVAQTWQPGSTVHASVPLSLFLTSDGPFPPIDLSQIEGVAAKITFDQGLEGLIVDHLAVVPEPASGALLAIAAVVGLTTRHRGQHQPLASS
jgi:hypothetical protein